jgi:hypothetical protein
MGRSPGARGTDGGAEEAGRDLLTAHPASPARASRPVSSALLGYALSSGKSSSRYSVTSVAPRAACSSRPRRSTRRISSQLVTYVFLLHAAIMLGPGYGALDAVLDYVRKLDRASIPEFSSATGTR